MKFSKLMKERIRRTTVLFRELGYEVHGGEMLEDSYTAGFENEDGFQGGVFIDRESKFLEVGFTFAFSPALGPFLRDRIEELTQVCYEYGCYLNLQTGPDEITFSLFSKLYYAGLNYFALKETLRDFREAVEAVQEVLEIPTQGVIDGDH